MLLVGLVATARAGKDTVAERLVDKYGFEMLVFSRDVIEPELKKRGMEITKMNMSILGDTMRKESGMGVMAMKLLEQARERGEERIVFSGFRSVEEVEHVRSQNDVEFYLVRVDADPKLRFKRRSKQDPQEYEAFMARDKRDMENKGMDKLFDMADYVIMNDSTLEELNDKVDEMMEEILP